MRLIVSRVTEMQVSEEERYSRCVKLVSKLRCVTGYRFLPLSLPLSESQHEIVQAVLGRSVRSYTVVHVFIYMRANARYESVYTCF